MGTFEIYPPTLKHNETTSSEGQSRRCGFKAIELLIAIAVVGGSVAFLVPMIIRNREIANRVACAGNLKQIGLAMIMYSNNERNGGYPRTYFSTSGPETVDLTDAGFVDHGSVKVDSFSSNNTPASANLPANSVGGSFYLVLKTQDLTPAVFICPASQGKPGFQNFSVQNSNNFGGWGPSSSANAGTEPIPDVTYSYFCPFETRAAMEALLHWGGGYASDYAIAADVNPGNQIIAGATGSPATVGRNDLADANPSGNSGQAYGNSINHRNKGQNVLYGDAHVEFQTTCWCGSFRQSTNGAYRDNIYTNGSQITAGGKFDSSAMPQDVLDSVLLPTSN